ncbi:MAG: GNAT family N-acetyltransferase [Chloracidobacterium sp.]|nr:GNAT family N-acetyltransferase [Chloracidobacterium sp.]
MIAIRDEWKQITQLLRAPRFFQCYEWYESYMDTLAEADALVYFVLARRQNSPVGIIPLAQATQKIAGIGVRSLELIQHPHLSLSDGVFARSDPEEDIIRGLIAYLRRQSEIRWDVVSLPNLLEDGCILQALKASPVASVISDPHRRCNYVPCISFDEYSETLSRNFRKNLRRAQNKLIKLSDVEYVSARQQPQLNQAFDEFLEVEASGWKGTIGERSAIKLDPRLTNFYRTLCETFSRIDACEINLLRADGRCLAAQFCLVLGDTSYRLKIGYDESYGHIQPGNLLAEYCLRRYYREGVVKYINLVSNSQWHANWNPLSYTVSNAYVFNTTPMGLAAFALLRGEKYLRRKYRAQLKPMIERWRNSRKDPSPNGGPGKKKLVASEDVRLRI